jgi:putative membrane protein
MKFLSDAWAIFKTELTLFQRFPKLRLSAIGVIVIPAIYALTYLSSVRDPAAHTGEQKAAVVNLDQGLVYRGQDVNIGKDIAKSVREKRTFNFVDVNAMVGRGDDGLYLSSTTLAAHGGFCV